MLGDKLHQRMDKLKVILSVKHKLLHSISSCNMNSKVFEASKKLDTFYRLFDVAVVGHYSTSYFVKDAQIENLKSGHFVC